MGLHSGVAAALRSVTAHARRALPTVRHAANASSGASATSATPVSDEPRIGALQRPQPQLQQLHLPQRPHRAHRLRPQRPHRARRLRPQPQEWGVGCWTVEPSSLHPLHCCRNPLTTRPTGRIWRSECELDRLHEEQQPRQPRRPRRRSDDQSPIWRPRGAQFGATRPPRPRGRRMRRLLHSALPVQTQRCWTTACWSTACC